MVFLDSLSPVVTLLFGRSKESWEGTRSKWKYPYCSITGPEPSLFNSFPDKLRGVLNEGGLFGERSGWHLPGFSTAKWTTRSPSQGLPNGPGVGFFVTTFELDVPKDVDAFFSFEFTEPAGQAYRALLFVNGWQYGKVRIMRSWWINCDTHQLVRYL